MNTTFLHLYETISKCLDCGSRELVCLGHTEFNTHYICEDCQAVFYWSHEYEKQKEVEA